ncbi:phage protein [Desemzia sp. FAM 23990]|uniref:phage protein n=1 Tax=Desemzia sp. FAM 23990 TaxID=3259520 RepID=UPI003885D225
MTNLNERVLNVTIEGGTNYAKYSYPEIEIHVDVPFDDDPTPNEATVTIYNLSQSSVNRIKKGHKMTVNAGAKKESGVLMEGSISKVHTQISGANKETVISLADFSFGKKTVEITFSDGTRAATILRRLAALAGITIAYLELPTNKKYEKGYKVSGSIESSFSTVIDDCGASSYYRKGKLYIRNLKKGDDERFNLSAETGLIGSPSYVETEDYKGYNIQCVLQYRIATASIITLSSRFVSGTYRVKSGRHSFDGSSFRTEALVIS